MSGKNSYGEKAVVEALLRWHGRTFARELGIRVENNCSHAPLALVLNPGLCPGARATTPRKMAAATWEQRTRVLNRSGCARYDEKTSAMLGDTARRLQERYGGDLRRLRDEAGA